MHTYKGPNGTLFLCNGDFSGSIQVINPDGKEFEIDGKDLQDLAESIYKGKVISLLEQSHL